MNYQVKKLVPDMNATTTILVKTDTNFFNRFRTTTYVSLAFLTGFAVGVATGRFTK